MVRPPKANSSGIRRVALVSSPFAWQKGRTLLIDVGDTVVYNFLLVLAEFIFQN